jgi:hypothetical protein
MMGTCNGDRIVVTSRRKVARPDTADGVLQAQPDGSFRWLTHRALETFQVDIGELLRRNGRRNVAAVAAWLAEEFPSTADLMI